MGGITYYCKWRHGMEEQVKFSSKWINAIKNNFKHIFRPYILTPPAQPLSSFINEKVVSSNSNHYSRLQDLDAIMNVETKPGPTFMLPDMNMITATQQVQLPLSSKYLTQYRKAAVLNDLQSSPLILFVQLCDNNCKLVLD